MSREKDSKTVEEDTNSSAHSERKRSINNDDHSPKSATLKRPRLDLQNKEFKDRGKRMLGMIFNTLNQFKKDTSEKTEAEKRREEIENKLQARLIKEKKDLEEEIKQDDELRRKKRMEEEKQRLKNLKSYCNQQNTYKANFIKTKATPHIYYLPAILNDETKKILEEQKKETLKKISLDTEPIELTSPLTPTPISARSEDSKMKDISISEKEESSDKEKQNVEDMEIEDKEVEEGDKKNKENEPIDHDDISSVDKTTTTTSNENSTMTESSSKVEEEEDDEDQDLRIDDAMDEVQY